MFRVARTKRPCWKPSATVLTRTISVKHSKLYSHLANNSSTTASTNDLGFLKSSQTSIDPNFLPFDCSHAAAVSSSGQQRDIMQLWSLLEACLHSNYMERAFSILESLYMIKQHRKYFVDDYNMYLLKYVNNGNCRSITQLDKKLMQDFEKSFSLCGYNDKTLAIMVHNALTFCKSQPKPVTEAIETYFQMSLDGVRSILAHIDVLSINDYRLLHNSLKLVKLEEIPNSIRPILEESDKAIIDSGAASPQDNAAAPTSSGSVMDSTSQTSVALEHSVNTLDKDAADLLAVDTIGMKVIRHALLGLSLAEQQKAQIAEYLLNNKGSLLSQAENKNVDFFQIYCSLEKEEDRIKFDKLLEDLNQSRQKALELRAADAAKERWKHDFEEAKARGDLSLEKRLNAKLWKWYSDMLPLVKEEVRRCEAVMSGKIPSSMNTAEIRQNRERTEYAPYMTLVDPEKMCVIAILEILKLNSTGGIIEGMRTARAVISVGKAIEMEFRSEQLLKNESHAFKDINKQSHMLRKYVQRARASFRSLKIEDSKIVWPQVARAKIGSIMISVLLHVGKVEVEGVDPLTKKKVHGKVPAFSHGYQYFNGSKVGVLKIHKSLVSQLNGERLAASVQPQLLPMLVKPMPWRNWKSGGYYYTQSTLIRSKDSPEQIAYLKAISDANAINKVYSGLNVLGDTAWTINRRIFNVISEVWNSGKAFLDIPAIQDKLTLLPPPPRDSDPAVYREWKLKNKELANEFSSNRSTRCDANYKLEIARAFIGEKLYFPHNLDFRGRAYPLSPHFNHLGNDISRGLLIFWKGKKLGPQGLKWLQIHLANLFGFDKAPLEDRVSFAQEHFEDIRDSAENPLNGKGWWKKADKPWQALATCFELNSAFKLDNPEEYISHQPVHQDGTCNGLQHYAALGGDVEGATQVNLVPSERPQDVYSHVAKLVRARLEQAASQGDENAMILKDKITRKVVKQTVMTNVYGVTYVGATFQIDKQLSEVFDDRRQSLALSKYLTKHVFATIRELFQGAHSIQDWLGECATRISKSVRLDVDEKSFKNGNKPDFMSSVIWTTPLGLPIVQPYREGSKKQVKTNLQTVFITDPFAVSPVNARRQKAGFPPNFIHSLDASHMLLSAGACGADGLEFASVHDSYWTHAADVDVMNTHLREQFIKLHEVDLIERLKNEFDVRYKNYVQIMHVEKSSEFAKKIMKYREELSAKLGRSATLADEIYAEKQRVKLLNSTHPSDVEEGKNMVTSISLTETVDDLESIQTKSRDKSLMIIAPLRLPSIPPKGDFDVSELRKSKYFFS